MIPHLENLPDEDFHQFANYFRNREWYEVTEKIDGSFAMSFWLVSDGQLRFGRGLKSKVVYKSQEDVPKTRKWNSFRAAVVAIIDRLPYFRPRLPVNMKIHCEVAYGKRPNTVEYDGGSNWIVFLFTEAKGKNKDLHKRFTDCNDARRIESIYYQSNGVIKPRFESTWKMRPVQVIKKFNDFDLTSYQELIKSWNEDRNKCDDEKKEDIKFYIKESIAHAMLKNIKSCIEGDEIEGLIIKQVNTGNVAKIVDNYSPNGFTYRNQAYWKYRMLLHSGITYEKGTVMEERFPGVDFEFKKDIAELIGIKTIRSINFKNIIREAGGIKGFMKAKEIENEVFDKRWKILCQKAIEKIKKIYIELYSIEKHKYPEDIQERTEVEFDESLKKYYIWEALDVNENFHLDTRKILELIYEHF